MTTVSRRRFLLKLNLSQGDNRVFNQFARRQIMRDEDFTDLFL
jgi:hypothetical protein